MTVVTGDIRLVTNQPANVTQVWLRAPRGRVQGTVYVTESPDAVQVENGAVSFTALPGPLVMVLVAQGQPLNSVKLIVPDKTNATLRECIEAAGLAADGTLNALERLAQEVASQLGTVPELVALAIAEDSTVANAAALAVEGVIGEELDTINKDLQSRLVLGNPAGGGVYTVGPAASTFPGWDGLVIFDDFRTAGEVVDSTSFSGHRWSGNGSWISDGSVARAVSAGNLGVDAEQSDVTLDAAFKLSTVGTGTAQLYRIHTGNTSASGGAGVWVGLTLSATGVTSTTLNVTVGGTTRSLVGYTSLGSIGFASGDPTVKTLSLRLKTSGTSVTLELGGPDGDLTLTGDLTTQEAAALSTWATVKAMTDHTPDLSIDEVGVETSPYSPQEDPVKLVGVDETGVVSEDVLPERLSQGSLVNLIKSQQVSAAGGGLDMLAAKLAFSGAGQHSVGVISDSSMNDGNDSLRIFDRMLAALLPSPVRHVYHNWNTADADWRHTVNSEGEMTPGHDGNVLTDTFSRVSSSLVGSSPDTGAAWEGNGTWISDGSVARANSAGSLGVDVGNSSMSIIADLIINLSGASNQRFDVVIAAPHARGDGGAMISFSIGSTGNLGIVVYTWDGGWVKMGTTIQGSSIGVTSDIGAPQTVNVAFALDIQNIDITITGPGGVENRTGQLSESQYINAGTWARLVALTPDTSAFAVDSVSVATAPQPPQGDILEVWNGAIGGAGLGSFDEARINQMFTGVNIDIVVVSMGHNNGAQTGAGFVTELETWLELWKQLHPETKSFIWVSQNPQFAPSTTIIAHRDRQLAIREAHRRVGMDYVGGYEAIASQSDSGASLVQSDGIHPTTPPIGVTEGDYGAVKVADAMLDAVVSRI